MMALDLLAQIDDREASQAAGLERRLLANFEGGCHTAFAAWARPGETGWQLLVGLEDDGVWRQAGAAGTWDQLAQLGPASGLDFKAPQPGPEEELCRPLQW
jgi:porphobilinogen deaminase